MKSAFIIVTSFLFTYSSYAQNVIEPKGCLDSLTIPHAFSPNGDSNHDYFNIEFPCKPVEFSIKIFNTWGEQLFESNNPSFQWHGNDDQQNPYPSGVYFYMIEFSDSGEQKKISGNVTIVR